MRPHELRAGRIAWILVLLAIAVAVFGIIHSANSQPVPGTMPTSLCGFPSTITPPSGALASGSAGAYASFTVTNTAGAPTLPTLATGKGSIVGALFFVTGNSLNVTTDGTAPNGNQGGMQFGPTSPGGATFVVCGSDLTRLKWVVASPTLGNSTVFGTFFMNGR